MAAPERIHHDLFTLAPSHQGIYWLRLYRLTNARYCAVVTEVPGNNGFSVVNGASMIRDAIAKVFSVDPAALDMFIIFPNLQHFGEAVEPAEYSDHSESGWQDVSRQQIEAMVGELPLLPAHAELFSRVLTLGGRTRISDRDVWEAVAVTSLPPPHEPFKCQHSGRLKQLLGTSKKIEGHLNAGRRFIASLTPADREQCSYHNGDWASIADASARIIDLHGGTNEPGYILAVERSRLPARDRRWLASLFHHPIQLGEGGNSYINGQHRSCALRFSGAQRAAVIVGTVTTEHEDADWTYLGDG